MKNDNFEEYKNPALYEAEYGKYDQDFSIFTTVVKKGSALDLACGTGRLTIELAKSGLSCVGLDINSEMLALAVEKSKELNICYKKEDMRHFNLHKTFDLVTMAGNSFQALLEDEDQDYLFNRVEAHLKPGGIFIFNTRNPQSDELRTTSEFEFWHDFIDLKGKLVKVYGKQDYNPLTSIVSYVTKRVWDKEETVTNIKLRFTDVITLQNNLVKHGFQIENIYGDFKKGPLNVHSKNIIMVCSKK